MTDDTRLAIDTALALEAAVRLAGLSEKNRITPAVVYRDNGGYYGPGDDVASVTWDQIRALRDAVLTLDNELRTRHERMAVELQKTTANWVDAETRAKDRLGRIQELEAVVANEAAKFQAETRRTSELIRERDALAEELRLTRMTLATVNGAILERDRLKAENAQLRADLAAAQATGAELLTTIEKAHQREQELLATLARERDDFTNAMAHSASQFAKVQADLATYKASAGEQDIRLAGVEVERDTYRLALAEMTTKRDALFEEATEKGRKLAASEAKWEKLRAWAENEAKVLDAMRCKDESQAWTRDTERGVFGHLVAKMRSLDAGAGKEPQL